MTDARVAALAEALLKIAYPWHDPKVDDPPVMEVGDLSDSGTETPWGLAERVLAALPPDWCGHNAAYLVATHGRQEAEIARLRTALEDHHRGVVLPGGTCAICAALGDGASS